jgi:hypothetical protein
MESTLYILHAPTCREVLGSSDRTDLRTRAIDGAMDGRAAFAYCYDFNRMGPYTLRSSCPIIAIGSASGTADGSAIVSMTSLRCPSLDASGQSSGAHPRLWSSLDAVAMQGQRNNKRWDHSGWSMTGIVKGFGCRPDEWRCCARREPASESLHNSRRLC